MKLHSLVAVVTGGSRGIGAAIGRRLAADGARVALLARNIGPAHSVAESIGRAGGHAQAFACDVTDPQALQRTMTEIVGRFGPIDVLVNNAGVADMKPLGELSRAHYESQFNGNTWSVIAATEAALPHFNPAGGSIVNVSSSLAQRPEAGISVYSSSKAAVDALTHAFARELGSRHIRVNAVAPHITTTDMTAGLPPDYLAEEARHTPLGRLAQPEDVADAVAFLASSDARWVNGRTLVADGGRI
ncbi:MAG: SDR family NAD(P)-dependent oxidoreductase [Rhizobacter sp.]